MWGATNNSNIDRLNKLQKLAARIILRTDLTTPSADIFKQLGWTSAVLAYKALNDLTPSYISDLLKPSVIDSLDHLITIFLTCQDPGLPFMMVFSCSAP